jgi:nicotinate-nucleotide adenylyltransferase
MNIGLYFGSFNPVHVGHLIIANHILNTADIEQIWIIVSPQNPFKAEGELLNEVKRLSIVKKCISGDKRIIASNVEFKLSRPSFTADTLIHLRKKYPQHNFSIIMGSDSFQALPQWKNFQSIIDNHRIFIYRRKGFEVNAKIKADIKILDGDILELSSTSIRELIRTGKSIRYLVPDKAREEIEKNHYYKK